MARIEIPRNPTELIALAAKVLAEHEKLGAASPFHAIEDWDIRSTALTAAELHDKEAAQLARDTQQAYELRDLEVARDATGVLATVRQTRDLLLAIYPDNPAKLGEFGFEVAGPAAAAPAVKPAG